MQETKSRSLLKTGAWRVIAVANSFTILSINITDHAFKNAIAMNISGFFIYYIYERICNRIPYGKIEENKK